MRASGTVAYVKDISLTSEFYKKLGFRVTQDDPDHLSVSAGDFLMDFHPQDKEDKPEFQKEANLANKGAGLFLYFKVDDTDVYYEELLAKGLEPSSEPKDWEWGNREFIIRDPDGYKLVFFHVLQKS